MRDPSSRPSVNWMEPPVQSTRLAVSTQHESAAVVSLSDTVNVGKWSVLGSDGFVSIDGVGGNAVSMVQGQMVEGDRRPVVASNTRTANRWRPSANAGSPDAGYVWGDVHAENVALSSEHSSDWPGGKGNGA